MSQDNVVQVPSTTSNLDTGIGANARKDLAEKLSKVLASTYATYLKTQNVHWNVTGPMFKTIHDLTEEQYTDMATANDEIAERIRALGHRAPGSFADFQALSESPALPDNASAEDMVTALIEENERLVKLLRETAESAGEQNDQVTEDLCIGRMNIHEKSIWMLSSLVNR